MNPVQTAARRHVVNFALGLLLSAPAAVLANERDVVLVAGSTDTGETMLTGQRPDGSGYEMTEQEACAVARDFLSQNLPIAFGAFDAMVSQIPSFAGFAAANEARDAASQAAGIALTDLNECANMTEPPGDFFLIYTSCEMIMIQGPNLMRWTVPPLAEEASMVIFDAFGNQVVKVPLETRLEQLEAAVDTGTLTGYEFEGPGDEENFTLYVPEERVFVANKYTYEYKGKVNPFEAAQEAGGGLPAAALNLMPKIKVNADGDAWIIPDAPGADVIAAFYTNFRDNVAPAAGMGSLYTGMVRYMADIASNGLPVKTTQNLKVKAGMFGAAGVGVNGTSETTIKAVIVERGAAPAGCAQTVLPEGVTVFDINQAMSGQQG